MLRLCSFKKKANERKEEEAVDEGLAEKRRHLGTFDTIFNELKLNHNSEDFRNFLRMPVEAFHEILEKLTPYIIRKNTLLRESISP